MLVYEHARLTGERAGAHPVKDVEVSLAGNPEDAFVINGRVITMNALERYLRYSYCFAHHRAFDNVAVIVELGGGSGTQVEVIKRLHPNVCFLMFDLPLQLYVCEQYLSTAFPDSVISYRETREMKALPAAMEGKILFFGTHHFPIIADANVDLFWNSSSFQEMEPDVVGNYLSYVNDNVRAVYLKEIMVGKELAKKAGSLGVLEQTTLQHYQAGLSKFKIDDISPVLTQTGDMTASSESLWTQR
jgi:putative sugar O-methyltransferase